MRDGRNGAPRAASWPWVTRVSTREPSERDRARGVIVLGSFRHGLFRIAFTVFGGARGPSIDFPCRSGRPLAWPVDEVARQIVVGRLIEILREKGRLPGRSDSVPHGTSRGAS